MPTTKAKPKNEALSVEEAADYTEHVQGFSWEGKNLRVSNPDAIARIRRKNFSASAKGDMSTCAAMFAVKSVLPRVMGPLEPAPLGNVSHEGLEHFYDLPAEQRERDALLDLTDKAAREHVQPFEETAGYDELYQQVWDKVSDWVQGIYKLEDPKEVDVYATEQAFKGGQAIKDPDTDEDVIDPDTGEVSRTPLVFLSNGVPFTGYLDRTDRAEPGNDNLVDIKDYKGLALGTPIPTPMGYTTVADLEVGDKVLAPSGRVTRVTLKSEVHSRPCFELTFSDGSTVVSDNVHDWVVRVVSPTGTELLQLEAQELHALFERNVADGRTASIVVDNTLPIEFPESSLPVPPYALGAWLGDGTSRDGAIYSCAADSDALFNELKRAWEGPVSRRDENGGESFTLGRSKPTRCSWGHDKSVTLSGQLRRSTKGCLHCMKVDRTGAPRGAAFNGTFRRKLNELGVLNDKRIPDAYLRGSVTQRQELVRGLMDTDGSWNASRDRAVFVNTNPAIANGMYELLASLGITSMRFVNRKTGGRPAHVIEFTPLLFTPFAIARKADPARTLSAQRALIHKNGAPAKALRRALTGIRPVESAPTQCIKVDDPTEMFLCGAGFVPTHNTGKKVKRASQRFGDQYGDQMRLYKDVIETNTDASVRNAVLLWPRQGQAVPADLSPGAVKATLNDFKREFENMNAYSEGGAFPTKPGNLCAWCPAANSCPVANIKSANAVNHAKSMPGGSDPGAPVSLGIPTVRSQTQETFEPEPPADPYAGVPHPADVAATPAVPRIDTSNTPQMETTMTATLQGIAPVAFPVNKWATKAVVRIADNAAVHLAIYSQPLNRGTISALSRILGTIVERTVQASFIGGFDWTFDAATEATSMVISTIKGNPAPFGGTREDWDAWQDEVLRLSVLKLTAGVSLLNEGNPEGALGFLVTNTNTPTEV